MNKKTVVIHQPDFLPYLGFFQRLLYSDLFVVLDNVQFVNHCKESWHRRNRIKTAKGDSWLTVGIKNAPLGTNICDIELNTSDWKSKNLNLIKENYKKASFYSEIHPYINDLYSYECTKLIDFNLKSIYMLLDLFDISINCILASSLDISGKNNELVINILKHVNADCYLSGLGAKNYFVPELYNYAGIEVIWQSFAPPVYQQQFGDFIPNLSSIDLLFNCGIEESRKILRSC